jgi:hypothetical protein
MQAQLWAGLRSAIWAAVQNRPISVFCVDSSSLKLFATGKGQADKPDMAHALAEAEPALYRFDPVTRTLRRNGEAVGDDEVDAIWLARYTAAVDRGQKQFLGAYQRKSIKKAERRRRKKELR